MQSNNFYDLNTADQYREFGAQIPDGEHVWLKITIKPGNASLPGFGPEDNGLFTASKPPSDFVYAAMEFSVSRGKYAGSKIFENFGFFGGTLDDKGQSKSANITKMRIRGIVESAFGIHPDDTGPQAQATRRIPSVKALENIEFAARIGVEEGGKNEETGATYPNRNMISKIILPNDPEYVLMRNNQPVEPKPMGVRASRGGNRNSAGSAGGGGQSALWQVEAQQHAAAPAPAPQPAPAPAPQPAPQPQYQQAPQQPQYQQQPPAQPAGGWQQQPPPPQYQQPPTQPAGGWAQPAPQQQPPQQQPPQQQPPQQSQPNGGWAQAQPQPQSMPATPPAPPPPNPADVWTGGGAPPSNQTADAPGWLNNNA